MAQNITIAGASYSDVPSIEVPVTGGGTAAFLDTSDATAAASDIASGMTAYVNGSLITGTASGGSSKLVQGTFTTSATTGAAQTVTIPYTGSGYPVAAMVYIAAGMNNSSAPWYSLVQRYAVGMWTMSKAYPLTTPTWANSGTQNQGATIAQYKNSTSSATTYAATYNRQSYSYSSTVASATAGIVVKFLSATQMSVFVAASSYGLVASTEYQYQIVYSS